MPNATEVERVATASGTDVDDDRSDASSDQTSAKRPRMGDDTAEPRDAAHADEPGDVGSPNSSASTSRVTAAWPAVSMRSDEPHSRGVRYRYHFSIEGSIGTGKSTTLALIKKHLEAHLVSSSGRSLPMCVHVQPEPVDVWCEAGLLNAMYTTQRLRAQGLPVPEETLLEPAAFQTVAAATRARGVIDGWNALDKMASDIECDGTRVEVQVLITERSLASDYLVFAKSLLKNMDLAAYRCVYDSLSAMLERGAKEHTVFLELGVDALMGRIAQRGRPEEKEIDAAYLTMLDAAHKDMKKAMDATPNRCISIDATRPPDEVALGVSGYVLKIVNESLAEPAALADA